MKILLIKLNIILNLVDNSLVLFKLVLVNLEMSHSYYSNDLNDLFLIQN